MTKAASCILLMFAFQTNVNCQIKSSLMTNAYFDLNGEIVSTPSPNSSPTDFDFLVGTHRVHHRKLKDRMVNSNDWQEFEGIHKQELILEGIGNLEQHRMIINGSSIEGMALRLFDPVKRLWSIYWADSKRGILDAPLVGSFDNKVGHFYARDIWNGTPIVVQFIWDARNEPLKWSQSFSVDNGVTWERNWEMTFTKSPGDVFIR